MRWSVIHLLLCIGSIAHSPRLCLAEDVVQPWPSHARRHRQQAIIPDTDILYLTG